MEGEFCLLEMLEMIRRVLLCMLEVLEMLEGVYCVLGAVKALEIMLKVLEVVLEELVVVL